MGGGTPAGALAARVTVLAVVVVFLQTGVVSEVPVFGVAIDLSPLVVAFVGLLCGSMAGATAGFGIGLLVDLTLVQTLGLTSLIFTVIGYAAGRLRELRDPRAALTPLLIGAAGAAASMVGYSLMEFMLGVDAPVSLRTAAPDRGGGGAGRDRGAAAVGAGAPLAGARASPTTPAAGGGARTRPVA